MKILDNITSTVRDDLRVEIKKGSKVSIAAACFSMYAYKELKKQLESVDEFRFIFTSPTFVKEKAEKQKREFYIPRLSRETSLYGTEFEIKLRNEMTQRAIAKECADWIRKKAKFKSNTTGENMAGFMTVDSKTAQTAYMPINGFTTVDIGCERGNNSYNMVNCMEAPFAQQYMQLFDGLWNDREKMQDVTDMVLENISTAYAENSPEFIYFMTLYHDPLGARLSPSRQRYGDIQTEQCALYRGQQRDRQREARHIGVCALYQHHVGVVRKGHQQESKDRH